MRDRFFIFTGLMTLALYLCATHLGAANRSREDPVAPNDSCDYSCLTGFVDQYLKAVIAQDPNQVAFAEDAKFTENTIPLKLGDALWGTASGMGTYKLYFADPRAGQVGFEGTIRENSMPAILLFRLRVVNRKIREAETMVHRNADDAKAFEKMAQIHSGPRRCKERIRRRGRRCSKTHTFTSRASFIPRATQSHSIPNAIAFSTDIRTRIIRLLKGGSILRPSGPTRWASEKT
jgi:hypothetical protein